MQGSILKRGKNTYLLRISLGRDEVTGKRIYRTRTFHGKKEDAHKVLRDLVLQYETTGLIVVDKSSLNSFLVEWLGTAKAEQLTESSAASYTKMIRLYIQPTLGRLPLAKITAADVQELYIHLREVVGIAPGVIRIVHSILNQAFKQAVRWRRVAINPVADTVKPRMKKSKAVKSFTQEQADILLETAEADDDDDVVFSLLLTSGMRPGELLALTWRCVEWENESVRVEASMVKLEGKPATFGPPKTPESFRSITLPPEI